MVAPPGAVARPPARTDGGGVPFPSLHAAVPPCARLDTGAVGAAAAAITTTAAAAGGALGICRTSLTRAS